MKATLHIFTIKYNIKAIKYFQQYTHKAQSKCSTEWLGTQRAKLTSASYKLLDAAGPEQETGGL